jgi:hypothetical protein
MKELQTGTKSFSSFLGKRAALETGIRQSRYSLWISAFARQKRAPRNDGQ